MKYDISEYINDTYSIDTTKDLFHKISAIPTLTPEEEQQLLIKMANGDIDARNELVVRNLKLVCTMASKFSSGKMSWLDLFQDGVIGLIEAIDNFKITMDCRLSTYAVFHIKKSILTAFKDTYNTIRLPKYFFDRLKQYKMLEEKYAQNGEKNLTTEEISQILGVNSETARFLQQYKFSTDLVSSIDEKENYKEEYVEEPIYEEIELKDMQKRIKKLLENCNLTDQEKFVLTLNFGFRGEEISLAEIGRILNVSRERTHQIQKSALYKIASHKDIYDFAIYVDNLNKSKEHVEHLKTKFIEQRRKKAKTN